MTGYCIGPTRWRVMRELHLAGGQAEWDRVRPRTRGNDEMLDRMVDAGLLTAIGPVVHLTARGRVVQELGLVSLAEFDALCGRVPAEGVEA